MIPYFHVPSSSSLRIYHSSQYTILQLDNMSPRISSFYVLYVKKYSTSYIKRFLFFIVFLLPLAYWLVLTFTLIVVVFLTFIFYVTNFTIFFTLYSRLCLPLSRFAICPSNIFLRTRQQYFKETSNVRTAWSALWRIVSLPCEAVYFNVTHAILKQATLFTSFIAHDLDVHLQLIQI